MTLHILSYVCKLLILSILNKFINLRGLINKKSCINTEEYEGISSYLWFHLIYRLINCIKRLDTNVIFVKKITSELFNNKEKIMLVWQTLIIVYK